MKQLRLAFGVFMLGALLSGAAAAQQAAVGAQPVPAGEDDEVTLTGCVVRGTDGGFVLTSVTEGVTRGSSAAHAPSGTTPAVLPRMLYWLDDDDEELEAHAGHRVEVKGEIEGDIDEGEIEIEREEGMIEVEIQAKGDKITVKLPDTATTNATAVGTTGTLVTDRPKDITLKVRKFDVKSVKMLAATCL